MPDDKKATIPDIQVCEENRQGCVHIIGDPHANADRVIERSKSLNREDTLYILGDIGDRDKPNRPGTVALIRFLTAMRKKRDEDQKAEVPKVIAIRGNHEDVFLGAYPVLRAKKGKPELFNGLSVEKKEIANAAYENFIKGGGHWADTKECTLDDLKVVHDYFVELPYLTDTPGKRGFNTIHADMILNEATLQDQIKKRQCMFGEVQIDGQRFSADDLREYATNARDGGGESGSTQLTPVFHKRTKDSKIAFVGHNALVYRDKQGKLVRDKRRRAVRTETNTVNLDGNATECDAFVVVNQTWGLCYQFGTEQEVLKGVVSSIQSHLLAKSPELVDVWIKNLTIENLAKDKIGFNQLKAGYQLAMPQERAKILAKLKTLTSDKAQQTLQQLEALKDEDFLLELAQQGEFDTLVTFLKRHQKIEIDQRDKDQYTALHYAAAACHVDAVTELCERGATPFIIDAPVQMDEKGLDAKAPNPAPIPPLPFVLAVANKTTSDAKPAVLKVLTDKCTKHAAVVLQLAQDNQWQAITEFHKYSVPVTNLKTDKADQTALHLAAQTCRDSKDKSQRESIIAATKAICQDLKPDNYRKFDLTFLAHLNAVPIGIKEKRIIAMQIFYNRIEKAMDPDTVMQLVVDLENLRRENTIPYLYDRQSSLKWSKSGHSWDGNETSRTWVSMMKIAKQKIMDQALEGKLKLEDACPKAYEFLNKKRKQHLLQSVFYCHTTFMTNSCRILAKADKSEEDRKKASKILEEERKQFEYLSIGVS